MRTKTSKSSSARKPLNTLESNARDKENVGLGSSTVKVGIIKSVIKDKDQLSRKDDSVKSETKDVHDASAQTEVESRIDVTDLVSSDPPSESYWKMLAEQRLKALEKTLEENEELHCKIEVLERQKKAYREMLDETTALVNVLQEMIGQDDGIPPAGEN